MAIREGDIIVVTSPYIPGYRVVKVLGVALGITVRSRGIGGRFLAGLRALAGGEIKEFTELAEQ
ncbi:MAG: heavy metal-binding domain-containing protein, partial [Vulcanisaeta sp.]|uniref:heavy metal-binding domain-containing protein n=1 Tax=Vulcanisaeta sp. TaxID=2020871 RepID=UPI003D0D24EA